jgi:SAM-dependent methyltransferase
MPVETKPLEPIPCLSLASFGSPDRLLWSGWTEHVPFAFWLIHALRPRHFVELGTHTGVSYAAFCQAVAASDVDCACVAVDTWAGDKHAGFYPEAVFRELSAYHDQRYGAFSKLQRATFDEALTTFGDKSIDLLHIDGLHTYDAVLHDFETWKPKLSDRAVVLFHDTTVRQDDFEVYRLWADLAARFPNFEFEHGNGLGVLGVGSNMPADMKELFSLGADAAKAVRTAYSELGARLTQKLALRDRVEVKTYAQTVARLAQGLSETGADDSHVDIKSFQSLDGFKQFYSTSPQIFAAESIHAAAQQIEKLGIYCPIYEEHAEPGRVKVHSDNYRETIVYRGLNSRLRAVQYVLQRETGHIADSGLRLYAPEAVTAYAKLLKAKYAKFVGSEYAADTAAIARLGSTRIEDLHALAFSNQTFDAVVANEVFEHVPFLDKALSELARIIVPGGKLVSTFPFVALQQDSIVRAKLENGEIVHLTEPEYHGNPVDEKGSLVFELPGWNIIGRTRAAGFSKVTMQWVYSPTYGMISPSFAGILVMVATK